MNRSIVMTAAGAASGAMLLIALILQQDVHVLAAAITRAGGTLVFVGLVHLAPLAARGAGWRYLLPPVPPIALWTVMRGRWVAESLNDLLPVAQVGGHFARAAVVMRAGTRGVDAGASVLADVTMDISAQLAFAGVGVALLYAQVRHGKLVGPASVGIGLIAAAMAAFFLLQQRGLMGAIGRLVGRATRAARWNALSADAAALDQTVRRLYRTRAAVLPAFSWHVVAWVLEAGELWLALAVLGHPMGVMAVVMWESLCAALRTAAFVVPAALGVQEASYVMLGQVLGVSPEIALAAALARRVREILFGVPGVVLWHVEESAAWVTRRAAARAGRDR
jgi:putative membrane protein